MVELDVSPVFFDTCRLIEVLEERRDLIRDVVEEVLAEFELVEDIREVKKEPPFKRPRVFAMPEGEA